MLPTPGIFNRVLKGQEQPRRRRAWGSIARISSALQRGRRPCVHRIAPSPPGQHIGHGSILPDPFGPNDRMHLAGLDAGRRP